MWNAEATSSTTHPRASNCCTASSSARGLTSRTVVSGTVLVSREAGTLRRRAPCRGSGDRVDGHQDRAGAARRRSPRPCSTRKPRARTRRRARREQVIFPDDLLPGVNSEPVSFKEAFAGRRQAHVHRARCCCSRSTSSRARRSRCSAPEIRQHVPHQQRARSSSSPPRRPRSSCSARCRWAGSPTGCKRVPIVGCASLAFACLRVHVRASRSTRSCCSGPASRPASPRRTASRSTSR